MTIHSTARADLSAPRSVEELDELLSRPTAGVVDAFRRCTGDVLVLGAGGKMGLTCVRMACRAADEAGDSRRVLAVSRFSTPGAAAAIRAAGADVQVADLSDREQLLKLPDAPNVVYLAGQKFGTRDAPSQTWLANVIVPFSVAERFRSSRIVALSTGNVYPLVSVQSEGSIESDPLGPVGEYASTCVGRERVFEHAAAARGTLVSLVRLNYAVDLRYGVLVDVASKVWRGEPIDVTMGYANVIWQGDACAQALQCLPLAAAPPFIVNVTGPERLSIRSVALELGRLLDREVHLVGREAGDALLSNTARGRSLFGPPTVPSETLLVWVAEWIRHERPLLGKATHFQERGGNF